jgi:hypothetical protein
MEGLSYADRVRAQKKTALQESFEQYLKCPETGLVPFATELYNCQEDVAATLLLDFRTDMLRYVHTLRQKRPPNVEARILCAHEADTLSTHFEWMSHRRELAATSRALLRDEAEMLAQFGFEQSSCLSRTHYLPWLLKLTLAKIELSRGHVVNTYDHLIEVARVARDVADPAERARIFGRLGWLYKRLGDTPSARRWYLRACLVRGAHDRKRAVRCLIRCF